MKSFLVSFIFLSLMLTVPLSEAAVVSVCQSCAIKTIQAGINSASSGDEVRITDSGQYNETVVLNVSVNLTTNITTTSAPTIFTQNTTPTINVTVGNATINGLIIIYNRTGGTAAAVESSHLTNITIRNTTIRTEASSSPGIKILYVNASSFVQNTIRTNGTSFFNHGMNITHSFNNNISSNSILVNGSTTDNYGIWMNRSGGNTVYNNTIFTGGTTDNYGISLYNNLADSTTALNDIRGNFISTSGRLPATGLPSNNYGIFLLLSVANVMSNNTILTSGTNTSNIGIVITSSSLNNMSYNVINTTGNGTGNHGIFLSLIGSTASNTNRMWNNTIRTNGTDATYGIIVSSGNANMIYDNYVSTNGTGNTNVGIYLANAQSNNLTRNTVLTNGTSSNFGLYLVNANTSQIWGNYVWADGRTTNNHGVSIRSFSKRNVLTANTITTKVASLNYGIYMDGGSNENNFTQNTIDASAAPDVRDESTIAVTNSIIDSTFNESDISFLSTSIGKVVVYDRFSLTVVNQTSGAVSGASVTLNDTNSLQNEDNLFSSNITETTNSTGHIQIGFVARFLANFTYNSSTGYLKFSNYTLNASKSGYVTNSTNMNITNDTSFSLFLRKIMVVSSPDNTTYSSSSVSVSVELADGYNLSRSVDGGSNSTISSSNTTFTDTMSGLSNGLHYVVFYANNTSSLASETVFFSVDVPAASSSSSGGGGGGSSGGAVSTTANTSSAQETGGTVQDASEASDGEKVLAEREIGVSVLSGEEQEFEVGDDDIPVTSLRISAASDISAAGVVIRTTDSPLHEFSGTIFSSIEIDALNFSDEDVMEAGVSFRVDRWWFGETSINESEIVLFRYSNGSWAALPTSILGSDDNFAYYEAVTPGFSSFVIGVLDAPVVEVATQPTVSQETGLAVGLELPATVAVVVICIVSFLVWRRATPRNKNGAVYRYKR